VPCYCTCCLLGGFTVILLLLWSGYPFPIAEGRYCECRSDLLSSLVIATGIEKHLQWWLALLILFVCLTKNTRNSRTSHLWRFLHLEVIPVKSRNSEKLTEAGNCINDLISREQDWNVHECLKLFVSQCLSKITRLCWNYQSAFINTSLKAFPCDMGKQKKLLLVFDTLTWHPAWAYFVIIWDTRRMWGFYLVGFVSFFSCRRRKVTDKLPQELLLELYAHIILWMIV